MLRIKEKRITFEYIMLEGVNDSLEDAKELIRIVRPLKSKINLIPLILGRTVLIK